MSFSLHTIAPRLAKARDQILEMRAAEHRRQRYLIDRRLQLERLVAHRELQLLRAGATRDAKYVKRRQDKLDRARAQLANVQAEQRRAA